MSNKNTMTLEIIKRNNTEFVFGGEHKFAISDGIRMAYNMDESVAETVATAFLRFCNGDYGERKNKRIKPKANGGLTAVYPISIQGNLVEDGIHCYLHLHPKFGIVLLMCLSYES